MSKKEMKLAEINAKIEMFEPYAKLVAAKGLDINAKSQGIAQGWIDRAKQFCELVAQREQIEG